ncbi:ParM/StbA family protein [Risungbinella massiliensis]|uniref:ParM/StbA family protein n=1 Tax=Risungbinella massiliensis TaxID=1329796 RepID=UPI0005CB874D|nr:ParM/StbA family protein [Risungbinella massiliensis]
MAKKTETFQIVSVDPGRRFVKASLLEGNQVFSKQFLSFVADYEDVHVESFDSDDLVMEIDSEPSGIHKKFFVGRTAKNSVTTAAQAKQDSKANSHTVVLTLTALQQFKLSGNIKLVMVVPIENHRKNSAKLREMLIGTHQIKNLSTNENTTVQILDVLVLPESAATYYSLEENDTDGKVIRIINIGSAKSNFCVFDYDGKFVNRQSCSSTSLAWDRVTSTSIERKSKTLSDAVYKELCGKEWDQPFQDDFGNKVGEVVYLTGGAANILYQDIKEHFPNVRLHPNALFSDCIGALSVAAGEWQ